MVAHPLRDYDSPVEHCLARDDLIDKVQAFGLRSIHKPGAINNLERHLLGSASLTIASARNGNKPFAASGPTKGCILSHGIAMSQATTKAETAGMGVAVDGCDDRLPQSRHGLGQVHEGPGEFKTTDARRTRALVIPTETEHIAMPRQHAGAYVRRLPRPLERRDHLLRHLLTDTIAVIRPGASK